MKNHSSNTSSKAILDLFMNFALALVYVLVIMPTSEPNDSIPKESLPPTEERPGDQPRAGREVMKITMQPPTKGSTVSFKGENRPFDGPASVDFHAGSADIVVIRFEGSSEWSQTFRKLINEGMPVVVEFSD